MHIYSTLVAKPDPCARSWSSRVWKHSTKANLRISFSRIGIWWYPDVRCNVVIILCPLTPCNTMHQLRSLASGNYWKWFIYRHLLLTSMPQAYTIWVLKKQQCIFMFGLSSVFSDFPSATIQWAFTFFLFQLIRDPFNSRIALCSPPVAYFWTLLRSLPRLLFQFLASHKQSYLE